MTPFSIIQVFSKAAMAFTGNTAAVILVNDLSNTKALQALAADFNQPATTFLKDLGDANFEVRWFAPDAEIGLCGHGTAAAQVFIQKTFNFKEANMHYNGGKLEGCSTQNEVSFYLDPIEIIDHKVRFKALADALGTPLLDYFTTPNKNVVLLENEEQVRNLKPNFSALAQLEPFGYAVTAPGTSTDFVSRTLVPKVQQLEDHATGSSHAVLTPFWAERTGKKKMTALQLSKRGGFFNCEMGLSQVRLSGEFKIIAEGTLAQNFI
jgi:predicted PhzF superfamily epimerase YddE/YHI9